MEIKVPIYKLLSSHVIKKNTINNTANTFPQLVISYTHTMV